MAEAKVKKTSFKTGYADEGELDLKHVGGYVEIETKEVHVKDNYDHDYNERVLTLVMEDPAGNKRVTNIDWESLDKALRDIGYCLEDY